MFAILAVSRRHNDDRKSSGDFRFLKVCIYISLLGIMPKSSCATNERADKAERKIVYRETTKKASIYDNKTWNTNPISRSKIATSNWWYFNAHLIYPSSLLCYKKFDTMKNPSCHVAKISQQQKIIGLFMIYTGDKIQRIILRLYLWKHASLSLFLLC